MSRVYVSCKKKTLRKGLQHIKSLTANYVEVPDLMLEVLNGSLKTETIQHRLRPIYTSLHKLQLIYTCSRITNTTQLSTGKQMVASRYDRIPGCSNDIPECSWKYTLVQRESVTSFSGSPPWKQKVGRGQGTKLYIWSVMLQKLSRLTPSLH